MTTKVIIASDWFNAFYEDGVLSQSGKPDYLDSETLARLYPDAEYYVMDQDLYDELLAGNDYPPNLEQLPLGKMRSF